MEHIKEAEQLIDTTSFDGFCKIINSGFESLLFLTEIQKSDNEDLINVLIDVENGR